MMTIMKVMVIIMMVMMVMMLMLKVMMILLCDHKKVLSPFSKSFFSLALKAAHVQQDEPIVEHVSRFFTFTILNQMVGGGKHKLGPIGGDRSNRQQVQ